jgi:hypothetical protein
MRQFREAKKSQRTGPGVPRKSAEGLLRLLFTSVQLLSASADEQQQKVRDLQFRGNEIQKRFQFEWNEFKNLHQNPLPLALAERLDWLSQQIAALSPECTFQSTEWEEIRATAADALEMMKTISL